MSRIYNAGAVALNQQPQGTVPDVSGALMDQLQPMVFVLVSTNTQGFQAVQVGTAINFDGTIQPFSEKDLSLRPEGQRAWSWYWVQAMRGVPLNTDDVIEYLGQQYRVMAKRDLSLNGFQEYQIVTDYEGSGPVIGGESR